MSLTARKVAWGSAGLLALCVGQCLGFCWVPGLDVLFFLLVGWIPFIQRVGPQVEVRWDLVASTLAYAAALVAGSHLFLRWLYREVRKPSASGDEVAGDAHAGRGARPARGWRWRWTIGGFALVVLMFATGTATVGIAHQTAWLARSPESLYRRYGAGGTMARVKCSTQLRQVGYALIEYAEAHGGQFPDDLGVLIADNNLEHPDVLLCPAASETPPDGMTRPEHDADRAKRGHTSYVYFGKGVSSSAGAERVLAVEPLEHHEGKGINVLYADGHAEWMEAQQAEQLLLGLGFERVEVPPRR